jgi:hypothetical protein
VNFSFETTKVLKYPKMSVGDDIDPWVEIHQPKNSAIMVFDLYFSNEKLSKRRKLWHTNFVNLSPGVYLSPE